MSKFPVPRWQSGRRPSALRICSEAYMACRLCGPMGEGRGCTDIVSHSPEGITFSPVVEVSKECIGSALLESPALVVVPEGRWRLYISDAAPGAKHWRADLFEADEPEGSRRSSGFDGYCLAARRSA